MNDPKTTHQDTKKVFLKLGTCSRTFFYILNREFGYPIETEERAADPLAGGIMQKGQQCGMLWGSALGVGAEAFRRHEDRGQAIGTAITATQHLLKSFSKRAKSVNCRDVTGCNLTSIFGMIKLIIFNARTCLNLAEKWAPEAIQSAIEGLSHEHTDLPHQPKSCASEVAEKMEASDEEMVMVAGFAGGLGLSGNACGALSAAIWMNSLAWIKNQKDSKKSAYRNPNAKNTLNAFYNATDSKILCHEITGRRFETIDDHTEFINNGGCDELINALAQASFSSRKEI